MAGVMIYRYRLFIPGFAHFDWLLAVVLFALLAQPYFRDSWLYDSCCIVLAFPLLISIGTNDSSNVHANRIWKVLGNLSYPFYLIHQPLVRAAGALYERDHRPPLSPTAAMCASLLIAACVAYGVFVLYDRPVRRLLTMARAHERPPRAATPATNS
jgi:peptidoglycan/LPS O-acetylase OafA/YrhL